MGTKYKVSEKGGFYHIYNRGNRKLPIFHDTEDYIFYLKKLKENIEKTSFSLLAYCLMPNHVHLLAKQDGEASPSKLISALHTSYAMFYNHKYQTVGHVFQGRFNQTNITENQYLQVLVIYIHQNPVKKNLAKSAVSYPWNSTHEHIDPQKIGLCSQKLIDQLDIRDHSGQS